MIENVDWKDKRDPYPISWKEQTFLMAELTDHLVEPVLFALHTGCREQEICQLRWDWEILIPEIQASFFVLPGWATKNGEEILVPLNSVAKSVVDPNVADTLPGYSVMSRAKITIANGCR